MTDKKSVLRKQAEQKAAHLPGSLATLSPEETGQTLHELRVHQIELEMQNEELRRTQEVLKAARELYFGLYNLAPVGYCIASEKGLILEANLTAVTLLGAARSELVKQPISRFILKEDQDIYCLYRKKIFETHSADSTRSPQASSGQTGEPHACELRMVKRDGTPFWARLEATAALAADGAPMCCIVLNDITDRKLQDAYQKMGREILQILNEPGDLQDSIQRVLAALKTQTGSDAVGIRLQDGHDFPYFAQTGFSKDFLLTENTLIERAADGGVCRDKDGNACLECTCGLVISGKTDPANPLFTAGGSFWTHDSFPLLDIPPGEDPRLHPRKQCIHQGYVSVALVPIRNKDKIVGLIQLNDRCKGRFTRDTVELLEGIASHVGAAMMRKQAEEAMLESRTMLESIANSTTDAIYVKDLKGKYKLFNSTAASYVGKTVAEVLGKDDYFLFPPNEAKVVMEGDQKVIEGQSAVTYEEAVTFTNGTLVNLLSTKGPLFDASGRKVGLLGVARDITERKLANQSRLAAMSEMISAIAHQWRQPLATLGMIVQRAHAVGTMQGLTLEYLNEFKANAMRQIRYMSDTIEEFRGFYRLEKQKVPFSPLSCINDAVRLFQTQFTSCGIAVDIHCRSCDGLLVDGFSNEFKQVILNLLGNARDAILESRKTKGEPEEGRIGVQISVSGDSAVTIDLSDNGCGIPAEIAPRIFAHYFTTKEESGGTGIGLYMSRMIVEDSLGGHLRLIQGHEGATFRIELPLEKSS